MGGAVAGEAPHTHQVVQKKDIAYVIERFEEEVEASLVQKRIALTPHVMRAIPVWPGIRPWVRPRLSSAITKSKATVPSATLNTWPRGRMIPALN